MSGVRFFSIMHLYAKHFWENAMAPLVHELIFDAASRTPSATALRHGGTSVDYATLAAHVGASAMAYLALGVAAHERVAVWCENCPAAVYALLGSSAAGAAMVPLDPALAAGAMPALLAGCGARVLVTSGARLAALAGALANCPALRHVVVCDGAAPRVAGLRVLDWDEFLAMARPAQAHRCIDSDLAALMYTGDAGVALSHRNLVAAARSVTRYLGNCAEDRLLIVLPLACDDGLHQLVSAFACGAAAVLSAQQRAAQIVQEIAAEGITGLAGRAWLWSTLARADLAPAAATLRYITNSGPALPKATLAALRRALPHTGVYLLHGMTEAFRSTYLAPEQIDAHPGSIGRAVPGADILVLRPDGQPCAPGEAGELVQRGALVALGYWNDPARTAACFKPLPAAEGLALRETAAWSGDTVCIDDDGYLYAVRRADDMIKTSGHRVRPGDVEEVVYGTGLVEEAAAVGVDHPVHGQVIAVLATARRGCALDSNQLFGACRARLPRHMLPTMVDVRRAPLPRCAGGRIDRLRLAGELAPLFAEVTP